MNNDTNLNEFIEAVNAEVDRQIEEIQANAEEKRNDLLENAEDEALNDAYVKIRACVTEEKYKSKMAVSKAEQEARIKVLTHREELVSKIFEEINDKLTNFTASEGYKNYLCGLLKNEKCDENTVVYLREQDLALVDMLRQTAGSSCAFEADSSIELGGLSLYDRQSSVLINKTIDNMLDEQKKDFGSNYRLA